MVYINLHEPGHAVRAFSRAFTAAGGRERQATELAAANPTVVSQMMEEGSESGSSSRLQAVALAHRGRLFLENGEFVSVQFVRDGW